VKQPPINVEEKIDRVVGVQADKPGALSTSLHEEGCAAAQTKRLRIHGRPGVHRFKTHEEADEWFEKMKKLD
jgi:hypothetical protein